MKAINRRYPKMISISFKDDVATIVDRYGNHSQVKWSQRKQLAYASSVDGCNRAVYAIPYVDADYVVVATKKQSPVFSQVC